MAGAAGLLVISAAPFAAAGGGWHAVESSLPAHPLAMQALEQRVQEQLAAGATDRCTALLATMEACPSEDYALFAFDTWYDECGMLEDPADLLALLVLHADTRVGKRMADRLVDSGRFDWNMLLASLPASATAQYSADRLVLSRYTGLESADAVRTWLQTQAAFTRDATGGTGPLLTLPLLGQMLGDAALPAFQTYCQSMAASDPAATAFTTAGLRTLLRPFGEDAHVVESAPARDVCTDSGLLRAALSARPLAPDLQSFLALQLLGAGVRDRDAGMVGEALTAIDRVVSAPETDGVFRLHLAATARAYLHASYLTLPGDALGQQVRAAADRYTAVLVTALRGLNLATTPGLRPWLETAILTLQREQRYLAATEGLRMLLAAFPDSDAAGAWRARLGGMVAGAWRDYPEEAALLRTIWTRDTDTAKRDTGVLAEARALYLGDRFNEALDLLQRRGISVGDPAAREEAQVLEILCEFRTGNVEEAKVKINGFLDRGKHSSWVPYVNTLRAYLMLLWGDYAEALHTCERLQGLPLDATQQRKLREMVQDLTALVARAAAPPPPAPVAPSLPNVILISLDTVRRDRLGCYGNQDAHTPNLDRLAAMGTVFTQAYSPSSWTKPAHASLFTGRYPVSHGAQGYTDIIAPRATTLPESLQALGYHTLATVSAPPLNSLYGFDRGFDAYDDYTYELDRMCNLFLRGNAGEVKIHSGDTASLITTAAMLSWSRRQQPDRPYFYFVNYFDAHHNYLPVGPFNAKSRTGYYGDFWGMVDGWVDGANPVDITRHRVDRERLLSLYDDEIAAVDKQVAVWTMRAEKTNQLDKTFFVVFGDHGEEFMEHASLTHGHGLYEEVLQVPFILCGPGVPKGKRIDTPVSLVDVLPTLLALVGQPVPEGLDGVNLVPLLRNRPIPTRPIFASLHLEAFEGYAVRLGDEKLILNTRDQVAMLYDLAKDPMEQTDLAKERPERVQALQQLIVRHEDAQRQKGLSLDAGATVTQESLPTLEALMEQLRAMGYLGN